MDGFIAALLLVMLCINAVVRRQWTRNERLAYPIVQLPVAMADPQARLFRNRLLWAGIAVAGGIDLLNGLAALFPTLPHLQVRATDLQPLLPGPPWNAMYGFLITFYPFVIGLGMLLPVDLLFSCWFFFLYWKAQMVIAARWASTRRRRPLHQRAGLRRLHGDRRRHPLDRAPLLARGAGARRWARRRRRTPGEPISYRGALLGVAIGFAGAGGVHDGGGHVAVAGGRVPGALLRVLALGDAHARRAGPARARPALHRARPDARARDRLGEPLAARAWACSR